MGFPIQKEMNKMAKKNVPTIKSGNPWTAKDEETIAVMMDAGFTEAEIGDALGRSTKSIQVRKVRIRARAGKIKAYNKATDVAIDGLVLVRKPEQQWADFRRDNKPDPYLPRSLDMASMEQFGSDEDSDIPRENNKKTSSGYSTLRIPHVYFYTCVYVVALSLAFFLGSIYQ